MFTSLLVGAISLSTVFLFGCLGETITEKAGHLNLGIPGIMCCGTAGGCFGAVLCMKIFNSNPAWFFMILFTLFFAFLFAALVGGIYAVLTVLLRCNQNITGLAITTFGTGFTQFFIDSIIGTEDRIQYFSDASTIIKKSLPFAENLGWFGEVFLSYGVFVYIGIALAIVSSIVLKRTRIGLQLRAVGESPSTADAAGINVTLYKIIAILVGSGIAGLGGFFYIMDYIGGSWENASTVEALGWLSIALVIFTLWKPTLSILGSFIFAVFYILAFKISGITFTQIALLKLLPYIVTIIVLIITSIIGNKNVQPPASLGQNYFREDR